MGNFKELVELRKWYCEKKCWKTAIQNNLLEFITAVVKYEIYREMFIAIFIDETYHLSRDSQTFR